MTHATLCRMVFIYKVQLENPYAREDRQCHFGQWFLPRPPHPGETSDSGPRPVLPSDWVCVSAQLSPPVAEALMSSPAKRPGRGRLAPRPGRDGQPSPGAERATSKPRATWSVAGTS